MAIPRNQRATALRGLDRQQAGQYVPNVGPYCQSVSLALVANQAKAIRFVAERTMTIKQIAFGLNVAASVNDNCDVGIFDSTLATLLGSSGSTAGLLNGAIGPQVASLATPVNIKQGVVYYAAFACGAIGGTAAQVFQTVVNAGSTARLFGATAGQVEQLVASSAFPLAAPLSVAGGVPTNAPILALLT